MPGIASHRNYRSGFTLIELLVTVTIVMILAAMTLPLAETAVKRNREQELRAALWHIREGLDAYKRAADDGRIAKGADESGYPQKLEVLVNGVEDIKDPKKGKLYFLRRLPRDPFNADTSVPAEETWGKRSYASPPDDPKEGDDIFDVHSLSEGTGINGIPYREW